MYEDQKIGVVILAYDVESFIRKVIEGFPGFVDKIYVVDDGSKDKTTEIVRGLTADVSNATYNKVTLLNHVKNRGPGAGLQTGYKAALQDEMDIIVKADGDGQMRPEYMENLIIPIVEKRADYTKGNRLYNHAYQADMPRFRLFGNCILTWLTRIESGYWHISDSQNGYTAITQKALKTIDLNFYAYYGYLNDILAHLNVYNFKVLDVPMPAKYGKEKSKIKYSKFIFKVSYRLLRTFLWRLGVKYCVRPKITESTQTIKL